MTERYAWRYVGIAALRGWSTALRCAEVTLAGRETKVVPTTPADEVARYATKSDWLVRDSFIKLLVNVIEVLGTKQALDFTLDFLGKLYRDAVHTIYVYEVKEYFEKRGAKAIVVFLRNVIGDLVVSSPRATYVVEVKTSKPPWGGSNIREYLAYRAFPGKVIYVWRENGIWVYADLKDITLDLTQIRVLKSRPLDELEV